MNLDNYVLAEKNHLIQVGDIVEGDSAFGKRYNTITRVSPKFAFYRNNEVSESKLKRVYSDFGWGPLPRPTYPMVHYRLFIPKPTKE